MPYPQPVFDAPFNGRDENRERVLKASMLTPALTRQQFIAKVDRDWDDWGRVIRDRKPGGIGAGK